MPEIFDHNDCHLLRCPAVAHASLVGPYGWGAPVYGKTVVAAPALVAPVYGKALVAAPAVATVSTQKTAINHIAPAAPVVAAAPLAVAAHYRQLVPYAYGAGIVAGTTVWLHLL
ncbi:hypothetical protein HNY73_009294 [Argiope bruennichi]|uniref:Cuticle protein n=1 Tax=Argiope bruennichi TaxID=94029 RepID=A0A8T0F940_ARGBR|nr:hypothetical protein HNY73_009294 [Argiope bruennichi]